MPRPSAPKITKACMPCRARKIKCDAASIGLPCSSCVSRETTGDCVLPTRKRRTLSIHASQGGSSHAHNSPGPLEIHLPRRPQPDLLYMNILQDTVNKTAAGPGEVGNVAGTDNDNCLHTQMRGWNPLLHLDEVDNEYLAKKGVFKLPAPQHMYVDSSIYNLHI
ncbi:hypothetical protein HYE68_001399 [Fusarium pseudograminearum]|nr:hypothetical protein HYE68_001399 [Fusarium pseudograminearum]